MVMLKIGHKYSSSVALIVLFNALLDQFSNDSCLLKPFETIGF